jgi:hypothetical protein
MARGRMISKSLSTSEKFGGLAALGDLAEFAQLLFPMLVVHSDDFGRLQGDPFTVKLTCLPVSPRPLEDFATALQQLETIGLIRWYGAAGKRYIEIQNFEWHQQGLHKRTRSQFPDIPGTSRKFPLKEGKEGRKEGIEHPPKSPFYKKGDFRPTRAELKKAELVRNRVHGGCPHDPKHQTAKACILALALAARQNGRAS